LASPTDTTLNYLACIPCLYWILKMEQQLHSSWNNQTLELCSWLITKTEAIIKYMFTYESPAVDTSAKQADGGWKKVSYEIYKYISQR
jgi:hypothetical protein